MLVRCPHCGKTQSLSPAELSACGYSVICPQCVSEFKVSETVVPEAEIAPVTHPATTGISFCPHCGQHLPASGLNFCPFCGTSLALTEAPQRVATPTVAQPASQPERKEPSGPARLGDMPYIAPILKPQHFSDKEASPRFKALAYMAITILASIGIALLYLINK